MKSRAVEDGPGMPILPLAAAICSCYIVPLMIRFDKKLLFYKLPPILYAGLILALSSIPNAQPPSFDIANIDKFYHTLEYFIYGLLVFRAFPEAQFSGRKKIFYALLFAFGWAFAACDETVQSFVPNRDSSVWDWLADFTGYTLAGTLTILYRNWRSKRLPSNAAVASKRQNDLTSR